MKRIHKLLALITLVCVASITYSVGPLEELLFEYARTNDAQALKQLLDNHPDININVQDYSSKTPLHWAAENDSLKAATLLLDKGADIQARNSNNHTPLDLAAQANNQEVLSFLITKSTSIFFNTQSRYGYYPSYYEELLFEYAKTNNAQTLKQLLDHHHESEINALSALINKSYNDNWTLLHEAVEHSSLDVATLLLDRGIAINAQNHTGDTSLHIAVLQNNFELASLLLNRGADSNAQNHTGDTPLHTAAQCNNVRIAALLLDKGANIQAKNSNEHTPLDLAARARKAEVVSFLITKSTNINTHSSYGNPVFYELVRRQVRWIQDENKKPYSQVLSLFLNDLRLDASLSNQEEDTALSLAQTASDSIMHTAIQEIIKQLDKLSPTWLDEQYSKTQEITHLIDSITIREKKLPRKFMMLILHSIKAHKPRMLEKLLSAKPDMAYDLRDSHNNDILDIALEGIPAWQDVAFKMDIEDISKPTAEQYEQIYAEQNELILKRIAARHSITYAPENLEQLYTIAAQEREELVKVIIKRLPNLLVTYRPDKHNMDTRKYEGEFGKVLAKVLPIAQLEAEQEQQANGSICA